MQIETLLISETYPDPSNVRKHSAKNIDAIKGSLKRFGQQKPIVVDSEGVVLAGNGTREAALALGWSTIEVVRSTLSEWQATAYALADNRSSELATWDDEGLKSQLRELSLIEDFDLDDIGFGVDDFDLKIGESDGSDKGNEDAVPDVKDNLYGVERGDIWNLGNHRVMCGDSTNKEDFELLLSGQKADLVFTDPPYRMKTTGGHNQLIGKSAKKLGEAIKHLCDFDPVSFLELLPKAFDSKKMNAYIFCNKDLVPEYLNWGLENGYSFNILVWKKPTAIPIGGSHRSDVEYLLLFRKSAIWNPGLQDVSYSKCLEFGRENTTDHPTMKPVGLIENEIKISSNQGSLVVDFFLGSGSTLIACEKTNRTCYGFEIDPHYVSVIIKRWEDYTGQKAVKL